MLFSWKSENNFYYFLRCVKILVHSRHTEKVIEGLHIAFIELPKFKPE